MLGVRLSCIPVCVLGLVWPLAAFGHGGVPDDAIALDPLVISVTRTPMALSQLASAVTVLGSQEIRASGARDLAQLLEQVPSLDISRAGGPGGTATLRLRGMGDAQVLLLVDGVEQNDPSSPGRAVDLATLPLADVERVEIVRGPQSALHGADAMAGVVQVITRRAVHSLRMGLSLGSEGERQVQASLARPVGDWTLQLQGSGTSLEGHSAARDPLGEDADGLARSQWRMGLDYVPSPELRVRASLSAERSRAELDNFGGPGGDDPNSIGRTHRRGASVDATWEAMGGSTAATVWVQDTERRYANPTDATHPQESLQARYQGRVLHGALQHNRPVGAGHLVLLALEWEGDAAESHSLSGGPWGPMEESLPRRWAISRALVLQDQWSTGPLRLGLAGRRDWMQDGADALTGRLSAGLGLLRASWGTGFKAPSLYQRHSPYGAADLQAEESEGWDAGVDLRHGAMHLGLGLFRTRVRRQIEFGADWHYHNISRATHQGVELEAAGLLGQVRWKAALQRQHSVDGTGRDLPRRPRTRARLALDRMWRKVDVHLAWRWEGARQDVAFDPVTWEQRPLTLGGAGLLDMRLARSWGGLDASAGVDNLFNRRHEEVLGYTTSGRVWRVGLEWSR